MSSSSLLRQSSVLDRTEDVSSIRDASLASMSASFRSDIHDENVGSSVDPGSERVSKLTDHIPESASLGLTYMGYYWCGEPAPHTLVLAYDEVGHGLFFRPFSLALETETLFFRLPSKVGESEFEVKTNRGKVAGTLSFSFFGELNRVDAVTFRSANKHFPSFNATRISASLESRRMDRRNMNDYVGEYVQSSGKNYANIEISGDYLFFRSKVDGKQMDFEMYYSQKGECFRDLYGRYIVFYRNEDTGDLEEVSIFSTIERESEVWYFMLPSASMHKFPEIQFSRSPPSTASREDALNFFAAMMKLHITKSRDISAPLRWNLTEFRNGYRDPSESEIRALYEAYAEEYMPSLSASLASSSSAVPRSVTGIQIRGLVELIGDLLLRVFGKVVCGDLIQNSVVNNMKQINLLFNLLDVDADNAISEIDLRVSWFHICSPALILCEPKSLREAVQDPIARFYVVECFRLNGAALIIDFLDMYVEMKQKQKDGDSDWRRLVREISEQFLKKFNAERFGVRVEIWSSVASTIESGGHLTHGILDQCVSDMEQFVNDSILPLYAKSRYRWRLQRHLRNEVKYSLEWRDVYDV